MLSKNRFINAVICLLPSPLACIFLRFLGHEVGKSVRIGFSLLFVKQLHLKCNSKIGSGCIFNCEKIKLKNCAYIGRLNIFNGPFSLILCKDAGIGNGNKITCGPKGMVTNGRSFLYLGKLSKITSDHRIDLTRSVYLGDFTTIAGTRTEVWTHGYVHEPTGSGRYRIDGPVFLGSNVYIGSRALIMSGVKIETGIHVGAGAVISKSLSKPGIYVSQALRFLSIPSDPTLRSDLKLDETIKQDIVYTKKI